MNSMGAPYLRRVFELEGSALENLLQAVDLLEQNVRRIAKQQCVGSIDYIRGSQAVMNEARWLSNRLGEVCGERNDVVVSNLFNLVYSLDRKTGARAYLLDGCCGDCPHFRVNIAHGQLHLQPFLKLILL